MLILVLILALSLLLILSLIIGFDVRQSGFVISLTQKFAGLWITILSDSICLAGSRHFQTALTLSLFLHC